MSPHDPADDPSTDPTPESSAASPGQRAAATHRVPTTALSRGPAPFPELAGRYLEEYLEKIGLLVSRLDEAELWWRPAPGTNSAGNLLLHLTGNLSLWILAGLGGESFNRDRAGEFAAEGDVSKAEALGDLGTVVARAAAVLRSLDDEELGRERTVQGYTTDGLGIAFHAVEHMSYHTGQIAWIVKQLHPGTVEMYPRHAGE